MTDVVTTESTATVIVATPSSATVNVSGPASAVIKVNPDVTPEVAFAVSGGSLGTQPTFNGAPLFSGSYIKAGNLVHFQIQVLFTNITSFGTGQYYLELPFASQHAYQFAAGCLHDISTGRDYPIFGHVAAGATQMVLKSIDAQGNSAFNVAFTHNVPVTLSTADNFHLSGSYIAEPEAV